MAISITADSVSRTFGNVRALDRVDLEIRAGEFFTLLGSSGSGKSTLLKLIGGFDRPTAGRICFDGRDVTAVPANSRPSNTVFQDLALFPHMTVGQNAAYGLRVRRVPPAERQRRVADALALVDLTGFEDRDVNLLSGGQRQRVALARALVMEPGILLLDEPLTGLDERLRQQMRDEFGRLHRRTGATFVLVTHNQDEALSLSDRMAILHHGRVEQIDRPAGFFARPANAFVARFIGMETILRPDRVERDGERTIAWIAGESCPVVDVAGDATPAVLAVRPDRVRITSVDDAGGLLTATVREVHFRGLHHDFHLLLGDGQEIIAEAGAEDAAEIPQVGQPVRIGFGPGSPVLVPERGGLRAANNEAS